MLLPYNHFTNKVTYKENVHLKKITLKMLYTIRLLVHEHFDITASGCDIILYILFMYACLQQLNDGDW